MLGDYSWIEALVFFAVIIIFLWLDLHAHRADKYEKISAS